MIKAFKGEAPLWEVAEAHTVSALAHVARGRFAYALGNGTVGMYDERARQWRVKSKYDATSVAAYDLDGDGLPELVSGWSNGKVEVRRAGGGEVVFRTHLAASSAALLRGDYRMDGRDMLLAVSVDGEARAERGGAARAGDPREARARARARRR